MADDDILLMTSDIVQHYLQANKLSAAELPGLIQTVHRTLAEVQSGPTVEPEAPMDRPSAAQIKKSIQPDGLVSFIDGKAYKTLRRNLTSSGMTPED